MRRPPSHAPQSRFQTVFQLKQEMHPQAVAPCGYALSTHRARDRWSCRRARAALLAGAFRGSHMHALNMEAVTRRFAPRKSTNPMAMQISKISTPSRCAARRGKALGPHDEVGRAPTERAHHRLMHMNISRMHLPSPWSTVLSTPSRCAALPSVPRGPHASAENFRPDTAPRGREPIRIAEMQAFVLDTPMRRSAI